MREECPDLLDRGPVELAIEAYLNVLGEGFLLTYTKANGEMGTKIPSYEATMEYWCKVNDNEGAWPLLLVTHELADRGPLVLRGPMEGFQYDDVLFFLVKFIGDPIPDWIYDHWNRDWLRDVDGPCHGFGDRVGDPAGPQDAIFTGKVSKRGGGLGLQMPADVARDLVVEPGDKVTVTVRRAKR